MGILQTPLVEPLRLDLKNGSSSCDSSDPWEGNKQSLLFIQLIEDFFARAPNRRAQNSGMSTPLGAGIRVVRGPDWKWGDQDGGEGSTGTVVEICGGSGVKSPENTVIIHWDVGTRTNYRIGHQNAFDIRVIDNSQIGIRHSNYCCKSCGNTGQNVAKSGDHSQVIGIFGIRWRCSSCSDVDLCTFCYMADKHDVTHPFFRIDRSTETCGILMTPRKLSRKVTLKGIFPGAKVRRGHDWTWDEQDGGVGNVGLVIDIQGWDEESGRSVASIKWLPTNSTNIYRVGHRGKVDLECIPGGAAVFGTYYPDHLPVLGRPPTVSIVAESASQVVTATPSCKHEDNLRFCVGEKVVVNVSSEVLKQIQEGHGGFNPRMVEVLGKFGVVHRITNNGDIRVQYPGNPEQNFRWTLNPAALSRVTAFSPGDYVRILDSIPSLVQLQADHGEWTPTMNGAAGKIGKVIKVYGDGDIRVKVNGHTWTFNPACLRAVIGSQTQFNNTNVNDGNDACRHQGAAALASNTSVTNQLSLDVTKISLEQIVADAAAGNIDGIRKRLSSPSWKKNSRNFKAVRASLLAAAKNGHLDVVELLVEHFPDQIDFKSAGKTCLHVAASAGHMPIVEFLLDVPFAEKFNTADDDGDSVLHYAAYGKQSGIMKYLLGRGADVNAVNATRCSVLHVSTVMSDKDAVRLLLTQPGIDVNIKDKMGDTPLHEAIAKEDTELISILCNVPEIDFSLRNRRGFNSMHYASLKGNANALKLIIGKARQLVEVKKDDGFSPLLLASLNGHSDCVRVLLDEGKASVDVTDNRGQTALHTAVHQGHAAVIEVFLSRLDSSAMKRLINKEDNDGETSLHLALSREGEPPVPLSVESSPLTYDIATKADKFGVPKRLVHPIAVAALLVKNGGKLNSKNQRENSPISLVLDPIAKTFLLDTVQQHQPKQVTCQKSTELSLSKAISPDSEVSLTECRICCEQTKCVTFQPCGHSIVCLDCSKRVKKCLDCGTMVANKLNPLGEVLSRSQHLIHELEAKVQEMEDKFTCTICMERNREVAFLCGHSTCRVCSDDLDYCHMCRRRVQQKITLY